MDITLITKDFTEEEAIKQKNENKWINRWSTYRPHLIDDTLPLEEQATPRMDSFAREWKIKQEAQKLKRINVSKG